MKKMVWLASYPKSGNTWFRAFLTNLLRSSGSPIDINQMRLTGMTCDRGMLDRVSGVTSSDLSQIETLQLQRDVLLDMAQTSDTAVYLKTHDSFISPLDKQRFFPKEITLATIYIVRNPLDIVVSYAHHENRSIDTLIQMLNNEGNYVGGSSKTLSLQVSQYLGSWSSHVKDWLEAPTDMNVVVLRYEDMISDTVSSFRKAVDALKIDCKESEFQKALDFSSFSNLKKQEQSSGFVEKNALSKSFFRKGIVGDWRNVLSSKQIEQIINDHGKIMQRLGYLDDKGSIVN